ncbi:uncharacterized protein LOC111116982 isoform X2 [Crassostrea virginica]|nr:uncharacterized protein LOC111116982 isoform X2 [Crassostrea virginica]
MKRNIARIQKYEHRYEKSANRPVQFLRFIKTVHLPQIQDTPHLSQHCLLSLTQKINTGDMIELLSEIKITGSGKQRQAGNELLPTLMSSPVLQKSLSVTGVEFCYHISSVTSDRVWVSDWNNVSLIDTAAGNTIYRLTDYSELESGNHTVNSESELIYIDDNANISKLSTDMKTTTLLIDKTDPVWTPVCVYYSPSSGDLLVGMNIYNRHTGLFIGKVMRYNVSCQPTQTIPQHNTPNNLYQSPRFITENNNGDVVVSDSARRAVVVTSRKGIHRFSYKGPRSSGPRLSPRGICTDVMSHILLCDGITNTVQMLSKDGKLLKYLLTDQSPGISYYAPYGLSYDFNTHCLWVESESPRDANESTLSVYRYINRHPAILDQK